MSWLLRDPLYRDVRYPNYVKAVVQHPMFQRLRFIAQNGLLHLVFPGMRHSRFEHSLGAAHIADRLFARILDEDFVERLPQEDRAVRGGITLHYEKTRRTITRIRKEAATWRPVFVLAALLHDVGHGPLSHTFEELELIRWEHAIRKQHPRRVTGYLRQLKKPDKKKPDKKIRHEHVGFLWAHEILMEIVTKLPDELAGVSDITWPRICAMLSPEFRKIAIERDDLAADDDILKWLGGYLNGPFDVDKLNYIRRDSRMAGVTYGQTEYERILDSVTPLFFSNSRAADLVGYHARVKHVHVIDYFLVSLYEMYTQVYHHPAALGFSRDLKEIVEAARSTGSLAGLDLAWLSRAGDADFLARVGECTSPGLVKGFLYRGLQSETKPHQCHSRDSGPIARLLADGWERVSIPDRPIVKDQCHIWLWSKTENDVRDWKHDSLVASRLLDVVYQPEVWWKNETLRKRLKESVNEQLGRRKS